PCFGHRLVRERRVDSQPARELVEHLARIERSRVYEPDRDTAVDAWSARRLVGGRVRGAFRRWQALPIRWRDVQVAVDANQLPGPTHRSQEPLELGPRRYADPKGVREFRNRSPCITLLGEVL